MGRSFIATREDLEKCYPDARIDEGFTPTHRVRVYSLHGSKKLIREDLVWLDEGSPSSLGVKYAYSPVAEEPCYGVRPNGSWQCLRTHGRVVAQDVRYEEAYVRPKDREGFVYFIQAGDAGPVKIGWSQDVSRRLAELQTANARKLRLLGVVPGTLQTEMDFHTKFSHLRMEAEWFRNSEELQTFIKTAATSAVQEYG